MEIISLKEDGFINEEGHLVIINVNSEQSETLEELKQFGITLEQDNTIIVKDPELVRLLYSRWSVFNRFSVLIPWKYLWELKDNKKFQNIWEDLNYELNRLDDNYEIEDILNIYRKISFKEFEDSREVGTLLYKIVNNIDLIVYIIEAKNENNFIISEHKNKFKASIKISVNLENTEEKWLTRRGALKRLKENQKVIEENIFYLANSNSEALDINMF